MTIYLLALLIGVIAGLRTMTAPAAVAWGAWLGWLPVAGTWASFMGHWIAVAIFTSADRVPHASTLASFGLEVIRLL